MTLRGPRRDRLKDYYRLVSKHSPDSLVSQILNTAPRVSTGQAKQFTALQGAFAAPLGTPNLASTLDGQVRRILFQNKSCIITPTQFVQGGRGFSHLP